MSAIAVGIVVPNDRRTCAGGDTPGNGASIVTSTIDPFTILNCPVMTGIIWNIPMISNLPQFKNDVIQFASLIISPLAVLVIHAASLLIS